MQPTSPRQQLQQAVRRQPADFIAWVMLADAELEAGDLAAGEHAARRALQLRPRHPEALARLGRVAWMAGAHGDAAQLLGEAAASAPQHPGIALWLGHALEDTGDAEGAAEMHASAADQVRSLYQYRLDGGTGAGVDPDRARAAESAERHYRLAALEQERAVLLRMARHNQLSDEIARKLLREIDLVEARYR